MFKFAVVESDAQEVVKLVNTSQGCRSKIFWIISEVQSVLKFFDSVCVQYTHRSCNALAHSLSKLALERLKTVLGMDLFPPHLLYLFSSLK